MISKSCHDAALRGSQRDGGRGEQYDGLLARTHASPARNVLPCRRELVLHTGNISSLIHLKACSHCDGKNKVDFDVSHCRNGMGSAPNCDGNGIFRSGIGYIGSNGAVHMEPCSNGNDSICSFRCHCCHSVNEP